MIAVIATMRAKTGKEHALLEMLKGLVPETRKEAGCFQYDLHAATDDPAAFAFYERWSSESALADHIKTAHIQQAFGRVPELVDGSVSIVTYNLVE